MSVLDDFLGTATNTLGVKSIADYFVIKSQIKQAEGLSKTQNTIAELTAATEALRTQTEYQQALNEANSKRTGNSFFANFDAKSLMPWALVAGGLFLAYKFVK